MQIMNKYRLSDCHQQQAVPDSDARMLTWAYYADIGFVNAQIGQVVTELEA